jgi:hypothetical protein
VKPPPAAASGAASATNPDNMPVKNPDKPTNDKSSKARPPARRTQDRPDDPHAGISLCERHRSAQ